MAASGARTLAYEPPGLDDARDRLFNYILDEFAHSQAFSGSTCPTLFIVYAHDNQKEGQANAEFAIKLIGWFNDSRALLFSDRKPILSSIPRKGKTAAVHDIVENQFCLLPPGSCPENVKIMTTVDQVIVCGSEVLKRYCTNNFTSTYISTIEQSYTCRNPGQDMLKCMKSIVNAQYGHPAFHHVLTEIAFLKIRLSSEYSNQQSIIRVSFEESLMTYLPFESSNTQLVANVKPPGGQEELRALFFKLLARIYPLEIDSITQYKNWYFQISKRLQTEIPIDLEKLESLFREQRNTVRKSREKNRLLGERSTGWERAIEGGVDADLKLPHVRNHNFVHRPAIYLKIENLIQHEKKNAHLRIGLVGIGGSGKTEIALDLAYKWRDNNYSVIWINGASISDFMTTYCEIAQEVGVATIQTGEYRACLLLKEWLDSENSGAWKMIIDNLDEWESLQQVTPLLPIRRGTVIITSRDKNIENTGFLDLGSIIEVGSLEISEAEEMLRRLAPSTVGSGVELELLKHLDYMPLYIRGAAGYMSTSHISAPQYFNTIRPNSPLLLVTTHSTYHNTTTSNSLLRQDLQSIFDISFDKVCRVNKVAWDILRIMSFLSPDRISATLLLGLGTEILGLKDIASFYTTLGVLDGYCMISQEQFQGCVVYRLHRTTGSFALRRSKSDRKDSWRLYKLALSLLLAEFRKHSTSHFTIPKHFGQSKALLPHTEAILSRKGKEWLFPETETDEQWELKYESAKLGLLSGYHTSVEHVIQACYQHYNAQDLPSKMPVQTTLALGIIQRESGNYDEAMSRFEEAMEKYISLKDSDGSVKSVIPVNQGHIYREQGHYLSAEKRYQSALALCQPGDSLFEEVKLQILTCQGNILISKGDDAAALCKLEEALNGWKAFGNDDQRQYYVLVDIAWIHSGQGKSDDAVQKFEEAIKQTKINLGSDHPKTLLMEVNYGILLNAQRKFEQALAILQVAYLKQVEVLTSAHPKTISTKHDIGVTLIRLGRLEEANSVVEEVLELWRSRAGGGLLALEYFYAVKTKADILLQLGEFSLAVTNYEEALTGADGYSEKGSLFHVNIHISKAEALTALGRYGEARNLCMEIRNMAGFGREPDVESALQELEAELERIRSTTRKITAHWLIRLGCGF